MEVFIKNITGQHPVRALNVTVTPHTVFCNYVPNCQLRSKMHITPAAALVLHCKRIGKCAMKNSELILPIITE